MTEVYRSSIKWLLQPLQFIRSSHVLLTKIHPKPKRLIGPSYLSNSILSTNQDLKKQNASVLMPVHFPLGFRGAPVSIRNMMASLVQAAALLLDAFSFFLSVFFVAAKKSANSFSNRSHPPRLGGCFSSWPLTVSKYFITARPYISGLRTKRYLMPHRRSRDPH